MFSKKTFLAALLAAGLVAVIHSSITFAQESDQTRAWLALVEESQASGKEKSETLQNKWIKLTQTPNAFKGVPISVLHSARRFFVSQNGDPGLTSQWFVDWYRQNSEVASLSELAAFSRYSLVKNYGPIRPEQIDAVAQIKLKTLKWFETDAWIQSDPQQVADMLILVREELGKQPRLTAIQSQAVSKWLEKTAQPDIDVPFILNVASWLKSLKLPTEYQALTQHLEKHVAERRLHGEQIPHDSATKLALLIPVSQNLLFQTKILNLWLETGGRISEMSLVDLASLKVRLNRMPDLSKAQLVRVNDEIKRRNSDQIKLDNNRLAVQFKDLRVVAAALDPEAKQALRQRTMAVASPLLATVDADPSSLIQCLLFLKETGADEEALATTAKLWLSGPPASKINRPAAQWQNPSHIKTLLSLLPPSDDNLRNTRAALIDEVWENAMAPSSSFAKSNESQWKRMLLSNGQALDFQRAASLNTYILKNYRDTPPRTCAILLQTINLLTTIGQFESAATSLTDALEKNQFPKSEDQALLANKAASILNSHNKGAIFTQLAKTAQSLMVSQAADYSNTRSSRLIIRSLINAGQRDKARDIVGARFKTALKNARGGNPQSLRETFELGVMILYCDEHNEGKIFPGYEGWDEIVLPHLGEVDIWEESEGAWASHLVIATPFSSETAKKKLEAQTTSPDPIRRIMSYRSFAMVHKLEGNLKDWQDYLKKQSRLPAPSPDAAAELMMARAFADELETQGRTPLIRKDLIESAIKTADSPRIKFEAYRMLFIRYIEVKQYDMALTTISVAEANFTHDDNLRSKLVLARRRAESLLTSQAQYQFAMKTRNESLKLNGQKDLLLAQLQLSKSKGKSPEVIQKLEKQIQQINDEIMAMK